MNSKNYFAIGAVVILLVAVIAYSAQNNKPSQTNKNTLNTIQFITPTFTPTPDPFDTATPSATIEGMADETQELVIENITEGTGEEAVTGKTVTVNYKGTLTNGTEFDSSYRRNEPFSFLLGSGQVIEGWEKGVAGMKVGGVRKLTIPPELGYGPRPMGIIPANSTLIFEVELLTVE